MATMTSAVSVFEDWPYDYEIVELKEVIVDEQYQRQLKGRIIEEMVKEGFNPALAGTIVCSRRSAKRLAVIDGQTRVEGAKRNGIDHLPAIVFEDITRQQEAALFALFQTKRRGMMSSERFRADVAAGHEPQIGVQKVLDSLRFRVDQIGAAKSDSRVISAPAALEYVYGGAMKYRKKSNESPHPKLLADTLQTIEAAWPRLPDSARSSPIIRGIGFYLRENPHVDLERLQERLGHLTPSALAQRAQKAREVGGAHGSFTPADMAQAIDAQYNSRRRAAVD